jgi:hypothetical protein
VCGKGVGRNICGSNKEEPTMATKKSLRVLVGICVISAWVFGAALPAGAETLNYKSYVWMNREESVLVDDVEGHTVVLAQRGGFYVCDNGELATIKRVSLNDLTKGAGSATAYETIKFADGSTIMLKSQSALSGTAGETTSSEGTSEIIKGTGRFEGIKGTGSYKRRFLPAEKGEAGSKQYGEGTITYTLPPK